MSPRTLRSKIERNALLEAFDGKCAICGCTLGDVWHADHITPWSVKQETNLHNMQPLCASCNLKKGTRMLRTHQKQFQAICQDIQKGKDVNHIVASVTPGGGKSALPVIAAHELIGQGKFDKICWVVPRLALQEQAEVAFQEKFLRDTLGHQHEIRQASNEWDPSRNTAGYATTYYSIGVDVRKMNAAEFDRFNYILVLDEPHHVWDGSEWHGKLESLVERAGLVIFQSGTLSRGDGKRIAFLHYEDVDGGQSVRTTALKDGAFIRYSIADALSQRAIIPLRFTHLNARADWIDREGVSQSVASFDEAGDSEGEALYTALNTEYAINLLDRALADWQGTKTLNDRAKLLVVAHKIGAAEEYKKYLRDRGVAASIATSKDNKSALNAIRRFKRSGASGVDVLVTVAMAYEGLDVPAITHVACLTHIRSKPWIEQMLARATRFDKDAGSWESQSAMAYVPDDAMMRDIILQIEVEQEKVIRERTDDGGGDAPGPGGDPQGDIAPLASAVTSHRSSELCGANVLDFEQSELIRRVLASEGVQGMDPLKFKQVMLAVSEAAANDGILATPLDDPMLTPRQKETRLRTIIKTRIGRYEAVNEIPFGTTNKQIIRVFDKKRENMTYDELCEVWKWVQQNCETAA